MFKKYKSVLVSVLVFLVLVLPTISNAQTDSSQSSLLDSIKSFFNESFSKVSTEIQGLRNEVQTLRSEVKQLKSGAASSTTVGPYIPPTPSAPIISPPSSPSPITRNLGSGDSGSDVENLQKLLIQLGFSVPAGVTGNFYLQTENALRQLQSKYGLPTTGLADEATRNLLHKLTSNNNSQPAVTPPPTINTPFKTTVPEPTSTFAPRLTLISPQNRKLVNANANSLIVWETKYAPAGSKVSFHLISKSYGIDKTILESKDASGEYEFKVPSNMPGDNEFSAKLTYEEGDKSPVILDSKSLVFSIIGGTEEKKAPSSSTTSSSSSSSSYSYSSPTYSSSNSANWVNKNWVFVDGSSQSSFILSRTDSEYAAFIANAYNDCNKKYFAGWKPAAGNDSNWQEFGIPECSATYVEPSSYNNYGGYSSYGGGGGGGGGGGASSMYKCFYPNATINGQAPGYTVWCEYDYQNCHKGDPSGESVSTDGLTLGAPSSCEGGWSSNNYTTGSECRSQASESACASTSGCYWYTGYNNEKYCDSTGSAAPYNSSDPSYACTGSNESTCTATANCYWSTTGSYCYYDSNGPVSQESSPFLANVLSNIAKGFKSLFGF